jgi:protein-tyrosine phosphatase
MNPSYFPDIVKAPSKIAERLYLGDYHDAVNEKTLLDIKVTHVINLCPEVYIPKFNSLNYIQIYIQDTVFDNIWPILIKYPPIIHEILMNKENTIFIHCAWGMSRSASLVIACLMYSYKMRFYQALSYVNEKRYIALPNIRFLYTLKKYDEYLYRNIINY